MLALILARYHNINLTDEMWTREQWKKHNGGVSSNYHVHAVSHNEIAEVKKKKNCAH